MGNGEQYIWKPPEDDDMLMHQNKALGPMVAHTVENIQPSAAVVSSLRPSLLFAASKLPVTSFIPRIKESISVSVNINRFKWIQFVSLYASVFL